MPLNKINKIASVTGFKEQNLKKINSLMQKHYGERCFIIGNGPSLKIDDLNQLINEVTFASNKVYLAFDKTNWRPSYYSVCDTLVAKNNWKRIKNLSVNQVHLDIIRPRSYFLYRQFLWVSALPQLNFKTEKLMFSENVVSGAYVGGSVIYFQIKLAYWMGFKEVILLGVDFSFKDYDDTKNNGIIVSKGESNHFLPEYRTKGEKWNVPLLDKQKAAFEVANELFNGAGRKIFNASRYTKLNVFEKLSLDTVLG